MSEVNSGDLQGGDLQIDTYRGGIGTKVAVRVTHRPTGIRAQATGSSGLQAREEAIRQLRAELKAELRDRLAHRDRVRDAEALTEEGMARDSER